MSTLKPKTKDFIAHDIFAAGRAKVAIQEKKNLGSWKIGEFG